MYRCVITDGCEIPVYNKHYENTFDVNTDDSQCKRSVQSTLLLELLKAYTHGLFYPKKVFIFSFSAAAIPTMWNCRAIIICLCGRDGNHLTPHPSEVLIQYFTHDTI